MITTGEYDEAATAHHMDLCAQLRRLSGRLWRWRPGTSFGDMYVSDFVLSWQIRIYRVPGNGWTVIIGDPEPKDQATAILTRIQSLTLVREKESPQEALTAAIVELAQNNVFISREHRP